MTKLKTHKRKVYAKNTLTVYWRTTMLFKKDALLSTLNTLSYLMTTIVTPFYISKILAGIVTGADDLNKNIAILAVVSCLGVIFNRFGFSAAMRLQAKVNAALGRTAFDRLLARSSGYHANNISGKLISDVLDFVASYAALTNALYHGAINFALGLLVGLVVLFVNSWQLGLFVSVIVIVTLGWAGLESLTRSSLRARRLLATKKLTAHLSDTIINIQAVKAFARENDENRQNAKLNSNLQALRIKDWTRASLRGNERRGVLVLLQLGLILYVVHLTKSDPRFFAAGIFAFSYTLTLILRLFDIDAMTRQAEEAFLQASPITKMLGEKIEIQDALGAQNLQVNRGEIDLNNVHFAYSDSKEGDKVFADLSLNVRGGEKIGLVGSSGGGKSTLTRILLRFEDIQSGNVRIDGQDIREVTQESLRQQIAYVPQEPLLFHRSIRENIAYGKPDATDHEISQATQKAHADEFIKSLPDGYDTVVGERGVKLSGGQRQRVAIARAILKDAPILILDEATSALDSESEIYIQRALAELMKNRTSIVIAHRLSTIQRMDRIVVMEQGRIVEQGSHKELLAQKGIYAKLWAHQSGGFIED